MAIFDRQPTDTNRSWAAFEIYREMGAMRSLDKLLVLMRERFGQAAPCSRSLDNWSAKFRWQERVQAWDLEQSRLKEEIAQKIRLEEYRAEVERLRKTEQQIGQGLISTSVDALKMLKELMQSPAFQDRLGTAPIGQVSALIGATVRGADSGIALAERSLAIDRLLDEHFGEQ